MKIDLHTHTNKSDGDLSPKDLMRLAKKKEIDVISVTDHDTIAGLEEAAEEAEKLGIGFLPGLEISVKEGREMHLLGYGIDRKNKKLNAACDEFMKLRIEREKRILEFLQSKGFNIAEEDIRRETPGEYIGRPHIANAMIKKGYVQDMREAFVSYLASDEFQKIERPKPTAKEGISVIEEAGGVAVLAHPHSLNLYGKDFTEMLVYLKAKGLKGMECYYGAYNMEEREYFARIAKELDLIITGGSDFHSEKSDPKIELGMDGDIQYKELKLAQVKH